MNQEEKITAVAGWLEQHHNIDAGILKANGSMVVCFAGCPDIVLDIPKTSGSVYLSSVLVNLTETANSDGLLREALGLNLYAKATRGAWIALNRRNNKLMLNWACELELCNGALFNNILSNFSVTASEVASQLTQAITEESSHRLPTRFEDHNLLRV